MIPRSMPLYVIRTTPAPDTPTERVRQRLRAAKPDAMLECPRCAGREILEARVGMVLRRGKPAGGTKVLLCATCHQAGQRVVIA